MANARLVDVLVRARRMNCLRAHLIASSLVFAGVRCTPPPPPPVQVDLVAVAAEPTKNGVPRFAVNNIGTQPAGPFRISVKDAELSWHIDVSESLPGTPQTYNLTRFACGRTVEIIVDVDNQVRELNKTNNDLNFVVACPINIPKVPGGH